MPEDLPWFAFRAALLLAAVILIAHGSGLLHR
jgi:hypothetical protein